MDINLYVLLLGLAIGLISGFLGLGGGILIVPLLPMVSGMGHHEIIGTSLFTILIVVSNNTFHFFKARLVNWNIALVMGPITGVFSFLLARLGLTLNPTDLKIILVVLYFALALWTLLRTQPKKNEPRSPLTTSRFTFLILAAGLAGALSGLTGIGSGMILGAVLLNLKVIDNAKLAPTSNAIMVFTCLSGVIAYAQGGFSYDELLLGKIHLKEASMLSVGAFVSSYFARKWQHKLSAHRRKWMLGGLLVVLGFKVLSSLL